MILDQCDRIPPRTRNVSVDGNEIKYDGNAWRTSYNDLLASFYYIIRQKVLNSIIKVPSLRTLLFLLNLKMTCIICWIRPLFNHCLQFHCTLLMSVCFKAVVRNHFVMVGTNSRPWSLHLAGRGWTIAKGMWVPAYWRPPETARHTDRPPLVSSLFGSPAPRSYHYRVPFS